MTIKTQGYVIELPKGLKNNQLIIRVLRLIAFERVSQIAKWGNQDDWDIPERCLILGEEVGEVQRAAYEITAMMKALRAKGEGYTPTKEETEALLDAMNSYLEELVQVAAVSASMVEAIYREMGLE